MREKAYSFNKKIIKNIYNNRLYITFRRSISHINQLKGSQSLLDLLQLQTLFCPKQCDLSWTMTWRPCEFLLIEDQHCTP